MNQTLNSENSGDHRSGFGAHSPEISVIIVNYNTADLTIDAIRSVLARDHGGRSVDIHVVDNASPAGDARRLEQIHKEDGWADRVILHLEAENHGFGRGNNVVLHKLAAQDSAPDKVFLLNPDAQLKNEAIAIMADFLDQTPKAGLVGGHIEKPGGEAVTAAFRFPSVISEFSNALSWGPVARLLKHWRVPLPPELPAGIVDWVAGAAILARFEALAQVDFFDPEFFLYYEEVDMMRQTRARGWDTWYLPQAEIIHAEGASTGVKSGRSARKRRPGYWYHSWQYYFRKNHGRVIAALAGLAWMVGAALNHLISRLRGRPSTAALNLFGDFWNIAARPILGLKARDNA